jgi:hypothetical protein
MLLPPALAMGFAPRWQERYLLYTHTTLLPRVLYAALRAHQPDGLIPLPLPGRPLTQPRATARRSHDAEERQGGRPLYRAPGND